MVEQKGEARPREALDPADHLHQRPDETCAPTPGAEIDAAPALRQPDLVASDDQLQSDKDGDDLEDVRRAARRQGQRGHRKQQDEYEREALLLEHVDEAPERLRSVARQPARDLLADLGGGPGPRPPAPVTVVRTGHVLRGSSLGGGGPRWGQAEVAARG